ncbi:hypothetical protein [Kitasatospora purpeofusca]|uniref:hypothetical protein n=1 Tax=Kitasatospora purpeofusca TaxID=67352 RepID=UPI003661DC7E
MSKFTRATAGILGAAAIMASSLIMAPAAHAASGGGCWEYSEGLREDYVDWKSCISSPRSGVGRPDAYVTLRAGHPACKIQLQTLETGGSRIMSQKIYDCPAGAVRNMHFTSPDFTGRDGRAYGNYTTIYWTSRHTATLANKSPWLKLP